MPTKTSCTLCPLHRTCKTVQVRSRGDDRPDVLLVGDAPGAEEDAQGRAFVGSSGRLLHAALSDAGCPPWRLTNSVRCRPPENRPPSPREVEACRVHLETEVRALEPRLLVALGRVALRTLTGLDGVMKLAGSFVEAEFAGKKRRVLVAAHPSYCLRTPEYEAQWRQHLQLTRATAVEVLPNTDYRLLSAPAEISQVLEEARRAPWCAFDYETTGLNPYRDQVRTVAVSWQPRKAFCFELDTGHRTARMLWTKYLREAKNLVAQRMTFETEFSLRHFGVEPDIQADPKCTAKLVDENQDTGLKRMLSMRTDMGPYSAELEGTVATAPLQKLWRYNCADADGTLRLWLDDKRTLPGDQLLLMSRAMQHGKMLSRMRDYGVRVDREALKRTTAEVEAEIVACAQALNQRAVVKALAAETQELFNPDSAPQMQRLLFGMLGLKPQFFSRKTKKPSANSAYLRRVKDLHPAVPEILQYRKLLQLAKNFLRPLPELMDRHGVVHADWKLYGTDTWRLSCGEPNLQNVPNPEKSDPRIRLLFVPRPGCVFVQADYSQIEVRVMAALSGEETLLDAFRQGHDVHAAAAAKLFGIPIAAVTKAQRGRGKTLNFSCAYGTTEFGLEHKFDIPMAEGKSLLERYWQELPKLGAYLEAQREHVRTQGWVASPFGHRRHLPPPSERLLEANPREYDRQDAHRLRQAGNFPIQCAAAQITLDAMLRYQRAARAEWPLVAQVHDSIIVECPAKAANDCARTLQDAMETNLPAWMDGVPVVADVETGPVWGEMMKWNDNDDAEDSDEA